MPPEHLIDQADSSQRDLSFPGLLQSNEDWVPRFERPGASLYKPKQRLWLHLLLLTATLFTTTLVGAHMQYNFGHNLPFFDQESWWGIFSLGLQSPQLFLTGLPFSLTLLTILMAHELGHYLACVYYGVDATLPFYLPSPVPITGTFGAFILIRSAIYSRKVLFDIGIAGPIAGFVFLLPALGVGLAFSRVLPGINHQGTVWLGAPILQWVAQRLIFPGVPAADIYLHPVARAAWVGMFATAFNLFPVGQMDGGHVVYALFGRWQKIITNVFLAGLLLLGILHHQWAVLAIILFVLARKHPNLSDEVPVGAARVWLSVAALGMFVLCFLINPYILNFPE